MATPLYYPPTQNALQKVLDADLLTGVTASATLNNVTGIQNKKGLMVIDRIDSNNNLTPSKREYISFDGTSGSTVVTLVRGLGGSTDQDHGVGAIVEFINDIVQQQAIIDGLTEVIDPDTGALDTSKVATPSSIPTKATATENVTGTDDAKFVTALANVPAFYKSIYSQALINGNFDVWQRGTTVAMTTANAYAADRWYTETATAGTDKTVSQQDGTGVAGSRYCARVAMVQDVDELLTFSQALESQESIKFRGKKLTLSFYARGGAEFVADNATLVSKIVTGKGTDQKVLAFTTSADAVSQNNVLTTDWQKFTCTTTDVIASDITQIGVSFAFTHAGSGITTNYFEVTQVQLCVGDVALPFMPKSYEQELDDCNRYCQAIVGTGTSGVVAWGFATSATNAYVSVPTYKVMRTTPTLNATAGDWRCGFISGALQDVTALIILVGFPSERFITLTVTVASGLTTNVPSVLVSDNNANRTLILDAEL